MHIINSKVLLLVAAAIGSLADQTLDLSNVATCAVQAATAALLSSACYDMSLSCLCEDPNYFQAFYNLALDYCTYATDVTEAESIFIEACANGGYPVTLPTSGQLGPTPTGSLPDSSSWSVPPPITTTSGFTPSTQHSEDCASTYTMTVTVPCTETGAVTSMTATTPGNYSATITASVTPTTSQVTTNGAIGSTTVSASILVLIVTLVMAVLG